MKRRIIKQGVDARDGVAAGAEKLYKAMLSKVGPFGGNWHLDKKNKITNDGVTIAREFQLQDEVENRGVSALREAAIKTVDETGDGTSTAIILAYEIYKSAKKFLGKDGIAAKKRGSEIIKQIQKETEEVLAKLKERATPITTEQELIQSAIVSTEDEALGTLIGKEQWRLGVDGVLEIEDSNDKECSVEQVSGLRLDNGFGTSGIVNNPEKWQLEIEDCMVLLTSFSIKTKIDWMALLEAMEPMLKSGIRKVAIIARAWTDETINYCKQNIDAGAGFYPLNAPYMDMNERMKDLAAITGAHFYDSESTDITDIMQSGLGRAKKVIARRMETVIEGPEGLEKAVNSRIEEVKKQMEGSESPFEKKHLAGRIAQLENGFSLVKIGSPSDMEKQRLLDKADDAIHAVKAALEEGTIKGAGLEAWEIAQELPDTYILKIPLQTVYNQIKSSAPEGYEVEAWVRDPLKVWRIALTNAASAAGAFATTEGIITEEFPKHLDELLQK